MKNYFSTLARLLFVLIPGIFFMNAAGTDFSSSPNSNPAYWSDKVNWSPAKNSPGESDNATILNGHTITVAAAQKCVNLTINAGGVLVINSGASLTVSGTISIYGAVTNNGILNANGPFVIKSTEVSTGSLIGMLGGSGTVRTVERYIPTGGVGSNSWDNWYIVSSPVSGQQLGLFATSGFLHFNSTYDDFDLAPYAEGADNWGPYTKSVNTADMLAGKGYVLRRNAAGTVSFSGIINTATSYPVTLTRGSENGIGNGWNCVGNPYASAICVKRDAGVSFFSINGGLNGSLDDVFEGLYIWDQAHGDYRVITNTNIVFPGDVDLLYQDMIAVGQGFLVKAAYHNAVIQFTTGMQEHATAIPFKSAEIEIPAARLTVYAENRSNQTIIAFRPGTTIGMDPSYDTGKLKGNPAIALYTKLADGSRPDNDFALQMLPDISSEEIRVPLGLDLPDGGEVEFSLETTEGFYSQMEIFLEDTQNQTLKKLNEQGSAYVTSVAKGMMGTGRFYLVVANNSATGFNKQMAKNSFLVYSSNHIIFVNGPATNSTRFHIYGIDGKLWYSGLANDAALNKIEGLMLPTGIYVLNVENALNAQKPLKFYMH